ncbi:helix-turn-helix domain-containing protein [Mycetohabitans rhizoxinica]|uniref:helix-turn-helix domain-containing protein n=1 Tax=Mycetohabitans rhizoxinica TaxID=412963 RepID=UPI0030D42ECB
MRWLADATPAFLRAGSHTPPFQPLVTALQLGQLLKAARKRGKLTQAEVAARLGLSQNRVSYLEQLGFKQLLGWCTAVGLELRLGERERLETTNKTQW